MEKGAGLRPRRAWREDSDSDRDATDDPAPKVPVEEETPLPDTEIPGAYPKMLGFLNGIWWFYDVFLMDIYIYKFEGNIH